VKQEELATGRAMSRRYRNRRIGEFLKELDLTEGRGTGVPKILRAMRDNGSPLPVFKFDEEHSYFATVLPVHPAAAAAATDLRGNLGGDLRGDLRGGRPSGHGPDRKSSQSLGRSADPAETADSDGPRRPEALP
jgi:hypothetical protein